MKVLLIEDNETLSRMMSKYFRIKKIDCTISIDGKEGLELILEQNHDVILLDLAMPDFSGYDIIESLEKKDMLKDVKIIVLTASSLSEQELDELVKRGVRTCLRKPVELNKLLQVIQSCV